MAEEPMEARMRALEIGTAKHEAICAERYAAIQKRLDLLLYVVTGLVVLLMIGEGTILDVAKRLLTKA
jgi:hypothetical protein